MSGRNRQFRKKRDDSTAANEADAAIPAPTPRIPAPSISAGPSKEKERKSKKVPLKCSCCSMQADPHPINSETQEMESSILPASFYMIFRCLVLTLSRCTVIVPWGRPRLFTSCGI